jgi:hypothetical protein
VTRPGRSPRGRGWSLKLAGLILAGLVVLVGLATAALFPMAWKDVHGDISVAAFGVAGAIVALVLPAASLGRDAAQRVVDAYLEGTAKALRGATSGKAPLSATQWASAGVAQIRSLRTRAAAARWGSGLVYVGFLLSMSSLLQIRHPVAFHIGRQPILPWHLAVAGALACLALGAVLFLPLAWWFWTPKLLESSEAALEHVAARPTQPATGPVTGTPAGQPAAEAATIPAPPPGTDRR